MKRSRYSCRYLAPLAAALLLASGCAETQWAKAGADSATVSRDLDSCRSEALGRASPAVATARSSEAVTDRGSARVMQPSAGSNERFVAEHQDLQRCMIKRGYELRKQG